MKYLKPILAAVLIYVCFYLIKVFVVNNLVDEFSPANPAIKLGLDCVWLITTIYVWRILTKTKKEDNVPDSSPEQ